MVHRLTSMSSLVIPVRWSSLGFHRPGGVDLAPKDGRVADPSAAASFDLRSASRLIWVSVIPVVVVVDEQLLEVLEGEASVLHLLDEGSVSLQVVHVVDVGECQLQVVHVLQGVVEHVLDQ